MISSLLGMLDDLSRASNGIRTATSHALPAATDDVATHLDDVTGALDDLAIRGHHVFDLADDSTSLSLRARSSGDDVRTALDPTSVDPVTRTLVGVPRLDDAVSGVRTLSDDVDDFVARARERVGNGVSHLDETPWSQADDIVHTPPWQPGRAADPFDDPMSGFAYPAIDDVPWSTADDFTTPAGFGDDAFGFGWS